MTLSAAASNIARHGGIAPTRSDRLENDHYFTIEADWIIPALLSKVKIVGPVLEPAAGVGHMVRELRRGHGLEVIASDLHAYEDPLVPDIGVADIRAIELVARVQVGRYESSLRPTNRTRRLPCPARRQRQLQRRPAHAQ